MNDATTKAVKTLVDDLHEQHDLCSAILIVTDREGDMTWWQNGNCYAVKGSVEAWLEHRAAQRQADTLVQAEREAGE